MGCSGSTPKGSEVADPTPTKKDAQPRTAAPNPPDDDEPEVQGRSSVVYQSKELQSGRASSSMSKRKSAKSAVFDTASIGTCTRHGIAPLPGSRQAKAKINQDRGVVCWPFNHSTEQALFCIFDGHGRQGERVSEFCMQTIPGLLESDRKALAAEPAAYIAKQVVEMDTQLQKSDVARTAQKAGTTSTVCYLKGAHCWVACSGDSRAVLGQRKGGSLSAKDLSIDHKCDLPEEKARILQAGGSVTPSGKNNRPPPARVWAPEGGTGLAMSRSIGDLEMRCAGVIPDPEVSYTSLSPPPEGNGKDDGDVCFIVASDGVWEFIESDEAVAIVMSETDATEACTKLVMEAQQRWKEEEGTYRDDITCIVAFLPFLEAGEDNDDENNDEDTLIQLNKGMKGLDKVNADEPESPPTKSLWAGGGAARKPAGEDKDDFVARRLSVHEMGWGEEMSEKENNV